MPLSFREGRAIIALGVEIPQTRYAKSGDVSIAYQVWGDGPVDLILVHGWVSNVEYAWSWPEVAKFLESLATFARVVQFDKRGTGLSDRVRGVPTLEERMDDVRAVMDATESARAILLGAYQGTAMSILFAATYPERVQALVLWAPRPREAWAPDYPWGERNDEFQDGLRWIEAEWGSPEHAALWAQSSLPSWSGDESFIRWWSSFWRMSASPGAAAAIKRMDWETDVRHVLPSVSVPTLVLGRADSAGLSRYVAERIPDARYQELAGIDSFYLVDYQDLIESVRAFAEQPHAAPANAVLATLLFTDIVRSTEITAAQGDAAWRELLAKHHTIVRAQLSRFRGIEIDTSGDGFFARFDGPARAIRCACAIRAALDELGISIRAGLHTGECELLDAKVAGIAVSIGARVAARAQAGEVLVSQTVKDLVAGSGLAFDDRGMTELKGVPGDWHLYAVASEETTPTPAPLNVP